MATKKYNTKGTQKQDLTQARAELKAAREQLKQFRHDVALLKRKGILDKHKYDARSVEPSKYLKAQIKKFANVLSGEAQPVKVSKAQAAQYKAQGYTIKSGRVVVPKQPGETVRATKAGFKFTIKTSTGKITRMPISFDKNNPLAWRKTIEKYGAKLGNNEALAFQFFGNNSHAVYHKDTLEAMVERLEYYPSMQMAENQGDADKYEEIIENIVLFKLERNENGSFPRPPQNAPTEDFDAKARRVDRARERYNRRVSKMSDKQSDRFYAEKADRERKRREALRNDPAKLEHYKEQARKRSEKSRNKNK